MADVEKMKSAFERNAKVASLQSFSGYQIKEQLYESAHSIIYRGRCTEDNRPVILKLLKHEYPTPEELARFRREYEMTRDVEIDGVIDVYALESSKNSLVMMLEDFGGESLTRVLLKNTPVTLSPSAALRFRSGQGSGQDSVEGHVAGMDLAVFLRLAIRISDILSVIHHRHIMHKGINPSNIVWNPETDQLKIIDFGIATELSREQPEIRNPNVLEGTLAYMSPEQTGRMNRAMDYRTDLYSLGATFYHLLTGQLPFQARDAMELVHCHLAKMPVAPCDLPGIASINGGKMPAIPGILSDIVMKLLAKNAEDRYQSAYGLKADLEYCLAHLQGLQNLEGFTVAQHDISERFQIPQKLYGREQEINTLLTAFERVGQGATELTLVAGYAGIGKSALIHEVHMPVVEKRGYFVSGKFDQFTRDIPYSALIQTFQGLMRQLLSEPEDNIAWWKETLLKALGPNGQVIIDVIPDVELIIGKQPEAPELPPNQAQNRFNYVFQNFVRTCAAAEHPLVIFLDDLQWADSSSFNLLELFMTDPNIQFMLIVGAYRDNEVSDAHPLMFTLRDIQKAGVVINTIPLTPLALEHVTHLITDTLQSNSEMCIPLAELCLQKTGGNPFFLRQFLQALYEDGFLTLDVNRRTWTWNLDAIQQQEMTDNVVELMTRKIQKLPEETQHVLQLAACIGNQFDLQTVSMVYEHAPAMTLRHLWDALQEDLISVISGQLPVISQGESLLTDGTPLNTGFRFLHDRIQRAAYTLLGEADRQKAHVTIGRALLTNTPEADQEERMFEIVNHLNHGCTLITTSSEKTRLAELNLKAGRRAKASTAYQPAYRYLQHGLHCLDTDCWQRQYQLTLTLYEETAEAAYLSGDFDTMEELAAVVLRQTRAVLETITVYEIQIQASIARNRAIDALRIGSGILRRLGVRLSEKPGKVSLIYEFLKVKLALLGTSSIEALLDMPDIQDPQIVAIIRIMNLMGSAAYAAVPALIPILSLKANYFSIRYGHTPTSPYGFAGLAMILCGGVGDIETGCRFGQLALTLQAQVKGKELETRMAFLVHAFVRPWKEHVRHVLQPLLDTYRIGMDIGDFEFAGHASSNYTRLSLFTGDNLSQLAGEMQQFSHVMAQFRQEIPLHCHNLFRQAALNLIGHAQLPTRLVGESYDEEKMIPLYQHAKNHALLSSTYVLKVILCYLFQEYSQAVQQASIAEQYLDGMIGSYYMTLFYFYDSLTRLALWNDLSGSERRRTLKKVTANQKKMKKWARHAPMNHLHKWQLVEAERTRALGKECEAMNYYENAIAGAREYKYTNEEALANELAAKFHLRKGRGQIARIYMRKARYCYLTWGAQAKVTHLDDTYPGLLTATDGRSFDFAQDRREGSIRLTKTSTSTVNGDGTLDLSTLMKASRAISGEMVLADLLKKMMQIVIENAGAQKGFLLLENKEIWSIEAEGAVASADVQVLQSLPIASNLPGLIVQFVTRTLEPVVLHDATRAGNFTHDSYIVQHHPQSILCFPLLNQGILTGMLYLENNLTPGAFTPERVEVLDLLSSQMAISIENARLYEYQVTLTTSYSRFVPRQLLSFLKKESIVDVRLGDQVQQEMTVLFSDIRGFTTLSERMSPQENFNFINSYLGHMEPVIHRHQGFIDKYIGDAIMALFPTNADDALNAAVAMLRVLESYNQERHHANYQPVRIGIGLNSGILMLGTVGGSDRMDGTVISDAVNLASRLEGLTNMYGASIVISEYTVSRLHDPAVYQIRFLAKVQVKGKTEPVSIFEVYDGDSEVIKSLKVQTEPDFEQGVRQYYNRSFAEAANCFKHVLHTNPDDKTAKLYLERAAQFMVQDVPEDWDGVETLEHK